MSLSPPIDHSYIYTLTTRWGLQFGCLSKGRSYLAGLAYDLQDEKPIVMVLSRLTCGFVIEHPDYTSMHHLSALRTTSFDGSAAMQAFSGLSVSSS